MAYLINNRNATYKSAYFSLENDIEIGSRYWVPCGLSADFPFSGNFNGNGHVIKNLNINSETNGYAAFIGRGVGAVIYNVTFLNANISATSNRGFVATLIGDDSGSNVTNIFIRNLSITAYSNPSYVGGVVGWASGIYERIYVDGRVLTYANTNTYVGGIAGLYVGDHIHEAINYAQVEGRGEASGTVIYAGGLIGGAGYATGYGTGNIRISYNRGNVYAYADNGYAAGISPRNYYCHSVYSAADSIYGQKASYGFSDNSGGDDVAWFLANTPSNLGSNDTSKKFTKTALQNKGSWDGAELNNISSYINGGFPHLTWAYWQNNT